MELRHLKYFVILAKELHFGRAAERLNIAQPPLSRQIQQLEEEVGGLLLHRTKRQVSLTDAGKVFFKQAVQILDQVDKASEMVRLMHAGEMGQIIVGFAGGTTYSLVKLQKEFKLKFPHTEFILRRLGTMDQVHALHEKKIHIGILYTPVESNKLHFMTMGRQRILAALPAHHPMAGTSGPIDEQSLAHDPFIMPPRVAGPSYHDVLTHICYQSGFVPRVVLEVYELETTVSLVSEGIGISLVPSMFRHHQVNGVVYKELATTAPVLETSLAWREDESSGIVHSFVRFAQQWQDSFDDSDVRLVDPLD